MESRKESHDRHIGKLEKHLESAKDNSRYSTDRFDILIISLSTSALILSIGFVKDIVPNLANVDTSILKTSWLMFVLALISNLISQVTSYYGNLAEIKVTSNLISAERGGTLPDNHERLDSNCIILSRITMLLNGVSLLLLIIGISFLLNFLSNNFK